jgi:hypothetical protein
METTYGKTVGGALRFKGESEKKHKKKHKKEKRERKKEKRDRKRSRHDSGESDGADTGGASSSSGAATAAPPPEEVKILVGTGRFLSSGTAVQGVETQFQAELKVGDALIVRHPSTLQEETRIVTMVLSSISISVSSPFSTDLISATAFSFISAPKEQLDVAREADAKRQKHAEAEKQAFGTYAGGGAVGETITMRVKHGLGYKIVQVQNTKGSLSREELLDMRCGNKADRHSG